MPSTSTTPVVPLAIAAVVAMAEAAPYQQVRVLDKPEVEFADPFTNVGGLRELSDGRVIVVDKGDRAVYLVDFKAGTSTQIGRPGGGPKEYGIPGNLLAVAGDSTLLTDGGNQRVLALGPDAQPVGVLTDAWPMPKGEPGTRLPRGIDVRGRGYFLGSAANVSPSGEITPLDSVPLLRAVRGSAVAETLAYVHPARRRFSTQTRNGKLTSLNIIIPPFSAEDAWLPFADGAVALVRVADYHVDWLLSDGRRVAGRPIAYSPVRVTDRDKADLMRSRGRPVNGTASGGTASAPPALDWPEVKPPFAAGDAFAGADGRVWIRRYGVAGDSRTHYDVIDRRGMVVARVDVPNDGRVVGFGARAVYVVRKDADDLQYLQRFPL
jgi:hypothetical protein